MFSFLENFDKTVEECSKPEEPLEEGGQHDWSNNGNVNNLKELSERSCPHSHANSHLLQAMVL